MGGSILVVEDEAAIRDLLAANLQRAGYKVMCAGDVPQAEALVRDTRPDLVLLDWVLPGVPGLTFARRLRSDQRTKDISIVLLSARVEEHDKVTALESGADDYVTKPFSSRELLARIKAVMRRRAPQLADDVVEIAGLRIDPAAHVVSAGDKPIDLWTTELRVAPAGQKADRPVDDGAAPAALLHNPSRPRLLARPPAGRSLGRARVRRG